MKLEGNNVHLQILLTFSQVKITFNETLTEDLTNDPLRLKVSQGTCSMQFLLISQNLLTT